MAPRVLVVDDKENMRKLLLRILADAYLAEPAEDGARALSLVATKSYDVVVTDIRMPGADGFELLAAVKARSPDTEVVMMTGYATVADAVRAMKQGAFDYLEKPFDPDAALGVIARAAERKRQSDAARALPSAGQPEAFHNLVGRSGPMREAFGLLEKAAALDITVLLLGETGTGKELAARAVHYHSGRRERRFVPVNCGALPAELVESELFGHAKGAFTGAATAKPGLFEEAEGGTLFLDEVGELPLPAQVKLNRALQEKEVRRVGDNQPIRVDVRVIAATHRDLREQSRAGRFREDLFYRLNVFPVALPALRERAEDVPLLAHHFLGKHAWALRRDRTGFAPEALERLCGYAWPGNVRELENAVERAVALSAGQRIELSDLPAEVAEAAPGPVPADPAGLAKLPYREAVAEARDRTSRDYLVALLAEFGGNVTRAAERAGLERESLHRLLRKHGIRSDDFK
ncbi:MAG TPA: sigma-54 dependent transcriptional regulator [Anaeromyxobacter sp.]|nr:sigma-54 dependent transcriptional regulator [Anaeromyxobacter sp.]